MTTEAAVTLTPDRRRDVVARRVRGLIAEQRLTSLALAKQLGMSSAAFSRRTTGELEFSFSEVELLAPLLGVDESYLAGFTNDRSPRRTVPGGGSTFLPIGEAGTPSGTRTPNPLIKTRPGVLGGVGGQVIPLHPRHENGEQGGDITQPLPAVVIPLYPARRRGDVAAAGVGIQNDESGPVPVGAGLVTYVIDQPVAEAAS